VAAQLAASQEGLSSMELVKLMFKMKLEVEPRILKTSYQLNDICWSKNKLFPQLAMFMSGYCQ
jgi:hypothetical protein